MPIRFVKRNSLSIDLSNSQLEIFLGDTDFYVQEPCRKSDTACQEKKGDPLFTTACATGWPCRSRHVEMPVLTALAKGQCRIASLRRPFYMTLGTSFRRHRLGYHTSWQAVLRTDPSCLWQLNLQFLRVVVPPQVAEAESIHGADQFLL